MFLRRRGFADLYAGRVGILLLKLTLLLIVLSHMTAGPAQALLVP